MDASSAAPSSDPRPAALPASDGLPRVSRISAERHVYRTELTRRAAGGVQAGTATETVFAGVAAPDRDDQVPPAEIADAEVRTCIAIWIARGGADAD